MALTGWAALRSGRLVQKISISTLRAAAAHTR
jgi:hypothetical protein